MVATACVTAVTPAPAATVSGRVVLIYVDGPQPKKPDHSGVVVWLEPVAAAPRPVPSSPKQTRMLQRDRTFMPNVLAIEVGTAIDFPNDDPIFHNVFSNYSGQVFDLQLYAPETSRRVVFRRPGMVHVFCNIHEEMSAVIAVLATPYFAVTGPDGRFEIRAPADEYRLQLWHERSPPDVVAQLHRQLTLREENVGLPEIRIEVSRTVVPHTNKYGHAYARRGAEYIFYPGARR